LIIFKNIVYGKGAELNAAKPSKDAWELVCKPKDKGDLGVLNLWILE
jgi:hypothetical protein